jgi:hypothetical protein
MAKQIHHLRRFVSPEESIIHENASEAATDHPVQQKRHHGGINASAQAANHFP